MQQRYNMGSTSTTYYERRLCKAGSCYFIFICFLILRVVAGREATMTNGVAHRKLGRSEFGSFASSSNRNSQRTPYETLVPVAFQVHRVA